MSAIRWGEQQSLLLDEVKEALNGVTALSSRMCFAARSIFVWHSIDQELQTLLAAPPAQPEAVKADEIH